MPFVKSLREVRVVTTSGDSAIIPARQAKWVSDRLLPAVLEAGCVQCDEDGNIIFDDIPEPKVDADDIPFLSVEERQDPAKRKRVIKLALLHIYKRDNKADFKADGMPRNSAVQELVRFPVGNAEIVDVLDELESA